MKSIIKIFKALSNKTRLKIIKCLMDNGELTVTQICERLKMGESRVSRNLHILENAYLVKSRPARRWVYYSLNKQPQKFHTRLFAILKDYLNKKD